MTNWMDSNRDATISALSGLETIKPMETDDNSAAEEGDGRPGGHQVTTDGSESEEEGSGSEEVPAPSELARSLGTQRATLCTTLQRIRRRLHGHGNARGITNRLTALFKLLWISCK